MSLTNKTIASSYGDILQVSNSGSGRTANGTVIKDGLGQSTSLKLGAKGASITPSANSTRTFLVENNAGTDLLAVDTTNSLVKAGTTQTYVNTQIKEFGVFDFSPTADTHHPMVGMTGISSASSGEDYAPADFGTGLCTNATNQDAVADQGGAYQYLVFHTDSSSTTVEYVLTKE